MISSLDFATIQLVHKICRWLSQGLVIALVCVLPWWFGGIQPWVKAICSAVILVAMLSTLVAQLLEDSQPNYLSRSSFPIMLVMLLASLGLGALQLLPLPARVLAVIAPANASTWRELSSATTRAAPNEFVLDQLALETGFWSARARWPISLYAESTKHDLALLCVAVGVFVLGALQFQTDGSLRTFLVAIAVCGACFGFFGIAQQLIATEKIYGRVAPTDGGAIFAAFANRNNGGGFLNLCLSASLGLLVWSLGSIGRPADSSQSPQLATRRLFRTPARHTASRFEWRSLVADLGGLQVFAALASIVLLGAVLCTLSRGSGLACVLSLAIAALASGWFFKHRWFSSISWGLLLIGGIGLTAWVGKLDDLHSRAGTLAQVASHPDGRWGHWRNCLAVVSNYWPAGSGLGTHRFIYRLHERYPTDGWFFHAENQYIEALVDGGWLGLSLLLAAILLTLSASYRLLRHSTDPSDYAIGLTGLLAVSTQAIQACFDFGLYLPANMCLLAFISGVVHGRARWRQPRVPNAEDGLARRRDAVGNGLTARAWRSSLATALSALLLLGTVTLAGQAELAAAESPVGRVAAPPADRQHRLELLVKLEMALTGRPSDAEAHLQAARAWIDLYRHAAVAAQLSQNPQTNRDTLWALSAPVELHTAVRQLAATNRLVELEDVRNSRAVRENLLPALRHLLASRASCPLLPEVHLLLSELAPVVSGDEVSGRDLERLLTCAPVDASLLAEAGLVALTQPQPELAARLWRQAITIAPTRLEPLLRLAATQSAMQPHLETMLPDDPELLVRAAREVFFRVEERDLQRRIVVHAKEMVAVADLHEAQRLYLEGTLFLLENQPDFGIDRLTRATTLEPLKVAWRFELAAALAERGRIDQALDHADFCVRMEPKNERYAAFLKQLNRSSLTPN